jgi:predicted aspartyl protease
MNPSCLVQQNEAPLGTNKRELEVSMEIAQGQHPSNEALKALSALMNSMGDREESGNTLQNQDEVGIHFVNATIVGRKVAVLIDTGPTHSFVGEGTAKSLHCETKAGTSQYKAVNYVRKQVT